MTTRSLALLFPGQGSQYLGMGKRLAKAFPEAADTFQEADEVLGFDLSRLMWEGPKESLVLTINAQPAILTHSVAVMRIMDDQLEEVGMAAGHSLGEFSAHVAAGTLSFRDALQLVRVRGELMAQAGSSRPGTMAAVLGMDDEAVEALCQDTSIPPESLVVPANFNSAGQVVISGDLDAIDRAAELAPKRRARRVVRLPVSGAFHSPLMKPVVEGLRDRLRPVEFRRPRFPVYTNVTAEPVREAEPARECLIRQLTRPVRWAASVNAMLEDGATRFLELGPGNVLVGLNRRNARGIESVSIGEPEEVSALNSSHTG